MSAEVLSDHRSRLAREKRDRMRKRLLSTVMLCFSQGNDHEVPGIDDVIREAKVSRTTFYQHFNSMEDAFNALSIQLSNDIRDMEKFLGRSDPLERLAIGIHMFLLHGVADRVWAKFVSRTNYISKDRFLTHTIEARLLEAREAKLVSFVDITAAKSLMLGSQAVAMRLLKPVNRENRSSLEELTVMILCGLRADYELATKAVQETTIYIRGFAPDCVSWWQDPWL